MYLRTNFQPRVELYTLKVVMSNTFLCLGGWLPGGCAKCLLKVVSVKAEDFKFENEKQNEASVACS